MHGHQQREPGDETVTRSTAPSMPQALLVDDDEVVLASLSTYARVAGLNGVCATNGLQALAMLLGGMRPKVIVTDLEMPNLDGRALTRRVREVEALREIPLIIHSASAQNGDDAGADLWLEKGHPAALVAALRS